MIYGTDIAGITDMPDPEILVSEQVNAAYACARRLVTPQDALLDIGEIEQYDSIDIRQWLGTSFDLTDPSVITDLQAQAQSALLAEPFASGVNVVVTFNAGALVLTATIGGNPGPFFQLVVSSGAAGVTAQLLLPGQS